MSPSGKLLAAQPAPLIFYIHNFTFLGKPFVVLFSLPLSITQIQILSSHNLNLFLLLDLYQPDIIITVTFDQSQ